MPTVTAYPQTISQTTGSNFRTFDNLNNLKNANNTIAKSNGRITGKNGSNPRPSSITCTNFRFNIPTGSRINKITVEYMHQKLDYLQNKYPAIPAPTVTLLNTNIPSVDNPRTSSTPTKNMVKISHSWEGVYNQKNLNVTVTAGSLATIKYKMPTYSQINSSNFGVRIMYFANQNTYEGWMQLKYIRIHVHYTAPNFSLIMERISNESLIVGKTTDIRLKLSNLANVDYQDTVTITLPSCVSLDNYSGGDFTVNGNVITWKPMQPISTSQLVLTLYMESVTSEAKQITAVTQLQGKSQTISVNISPTPTPVVDETEFDSETIIHAKTGEEFELDVKIPSNLVEDADSVFLIPSKNLQIEEDGNWTTVNADAEYEIDIDEFTDNHCILNCKSTVAGITNIIVGTGDIVPEVPNFILKIIPSSLQYPSYVIYEVVGEELDRLGDGFVYTVQSNLRIDCDVEDIGNFTDYYRNFRIGVFNQELPDGVNIGNYVFDKSQIWSSLLSTFNNWEDKTVEFTFNKDYPLYIIITSEFITAQPTDFSLSYTPPAIIESSVYTKYETPGNYPAPILKTLQSDTYSEITVNTFEKSTPIVFYDFPFEEEFGTDSKYAVRGIQFDCDVECDSRVVGLLKLKHPQGETGEKSIILENNETNHITLGGNFDTWGFKISQLNNIKDWEFELELQNLFSNENNTSEVQLKNVQVTAYYIEIPSDKTYCIIDGEDARYYGIFLDEPDIPFGVKTDTKYHDLDGIDMNDAYRMNITKKEIKLKFNLFGCNFDETTQQLKEIAKLLTNKRDKLNRPIPKTIEFSHLPGEHFDYIMPDPIDPKMNASDYDPEVKLVIPDGTSWANEDTVTSNIGSNDGIAKVSPIISLIPLSQTVDITELNSNQKFSITYSGFNSDKIVEINCNTQQVLLKSNEGDSNPINITDYADFGVDWFKLEVGEYVFDAGSSAIIQSVTITQRG